ncbi:uncharacterized protein LOC113389179 [Ctenocephalides felis]|uniref:uncharacterized protein LOC113389179 n=1 Tax=Ctenocephalides felis TaxID=7515 RepID=UPI000E6E11A3|nr:uncharacterized protein LOC113389179 [Ctenocephalides felis]
MLPQFHRHHQLLQPTPLLQTPLPFLLLFIHMLPPFHRHHQLLPTSSTPLPHNPLLAPVFNSRLQQQTIFQVLKGNLGSCAPFRIVKSCFPDKMPYINISKLITPSTSSMKK